MSSTSNIIHAQFYKVSDNHNYLNLKLEQVKEHEYIISSIEESASFTTSRTTDNNVRQIALAKGQTWGYDKLKTLAQTLTNYQYVLEGVLVVDHS